MPAVFTDKLYFGSRALSVLFPLPVRSRMEREGEGSRWPRRSALAVVYESVVII